MSEALQRPLLAPHRTMGVQFRILPLRHSKAKAAPNLSRLRLNLAMTSPSAIST